MNHKLKEELQKLARNEIRISYSTAEKVLSLCSSKIGGNPAVPADFIWPMYTDEDGTSRPLSFMAQINLKETAKYDKEGLLPKKGILSFFYDLYAMPWGFDPKDKGAARVYYFSDETELISMDAPEQPEEETEIPALAVAFEEHISLPYPENLYDADFDWDEYEECCEDLGYESDEMGDVTKLLGFPDVIQSPMETECEAVTRGYRQGCPEDDAGIPDAEKADIKAKASQWILLFQMGTIPTDEGEIMFGDCGHLYFWIKKSDLQNGCFDHVWCILQCG